MSDESLCVGGCGAPAPDDAYLESVCVEKLRGAFRQIADSLADLELTATRQSKTSSGGSKQRDGENEDDNRVGSARPDNYITGEGLNLPFSESAADLLNDVVNWLRSNAIYLAQLEYGDGNPSMPWPLAVASWLAHHAPVIAQYPTISEGWLHEATKYAHDIRATIDNRPAKVFYGPCRATRTETTIVNDHEVTRETTCTEDLYAEKTDKKTVCPTCGTTHDLPRTEWLKTEMMTASVTIDEVLKSLPTLFPTLRVKRATVNSWVRRGRLTPVGNVGGSDLFNGKELIELIEDDQVRTGPKRKQVA